MGKTSSHRPSYCLEGEPQGRGASLEQDGGHLSLAGHLGQPCIEERSLTWWAAAWALLHEQPPWCPSCVQAQCGAFLTAGWGSSTWAWTVLLGFPPSLAPEHAPGSFLISQHHLLISASNEGSFCGSRQLSFSQSSRGEACLGVPGQAVSSLSQRAEQRLNSPAGFAMPPLVLQEASPGVC